MKRLVVFEITEPIYTLGSKIKRIAYSEKHVSILTLITVRNRVLGI